MKRVKVKYANGGTSSAIGSGASLVGKTLTASAVEEDGSINDGKYALGTGLEWGATGLMMGGPIGAGIGLLAGTIIGNRRAEKQNAALKKAKEREMAAQEAADTSRSRAILDNYDSEGVDENVTFYKFGGVKKIASNAVQAVGPTHEQGGIQIGDTEVEGNEIGVTGEYNQVWFSKRLNRNSGESFSDAAKKLITKQGKEEEGLEHPSKYKRGTSLRNIQKIEADVEALAQEQMAKQIELGLPTTGSKAAYGSIEFGDPTKKTFSTLDDRPPGPDLLLGTPPSSEVDPEGVAFGTTGTVLDVPQVDYNYDAFNTDGYVPPKEKTPEEIAAEKAANREKWMGRLDTASNYLLAGVDNAVNAAITRNTPHIPAPQMRKAISLDTDYSIRAPLADINRQTRDASNSILRNTTNSAIARNNIIAADVAAIAPKNQLYDTKTNQELALRNANLQNAQRTDEINKQLTDDFRFKKVLRVDDIQQRISANATNFVNDVVQLRREKNQKDVEAATMELLKKKYQDTGIFDRNLSGALEDFLLGKITEEEFKRRAQVQADLKASKEKDSKSTN